LFAVLLVSRPELFGLPERIDEPLFGLDAKTHELERLMGPASALWLVVFVIPMFLFTPDAAKRNIPLLQAARQGGSSLLHTVRRLGRFRNALRYLIAFMLYNDGLAAIIAFGGVYAAATFGWSTVTLGIFGIILTVFAIPGAFLGGRLDDKLGSKRVVQMAIVGVIVAAVGIVGVSADRVLFFIPAAELSPARDLFGSLQERVFMGFALLLGICMGPMQAASRTMIGRLAPEGMTGEFFGLFALSGRATAWMAPLAIGIITEATSSNRLGVACVLVFLVLGFVLLWGVREERAKA
jgi:UMF1 family MFS transporter